MHIKKDDTDKGSVASSVKYRMSEKLKQKKKAAEAQALVEQVNLELLEAEESLTCDYRSDRSRSKKGVGTSQLANTKLQSFDQYSNRVCRTTG